jgi:hypothetical protein
MNYKSSGRTECSTGNTFDLYSGCALSNLGGDTGYPDWRFTWFYQYLQANGGIVLRSAHGRFLPMFSSS